MKRELANQNSDRHGIALVIVLSLMAAMMVLAVGFAVSMRTEHKAAKMSGTRIQAIEMCYYGLAQALDHIESDALSSTWWPSTGGTPPMGSIGPGWVYPGWSNHCIHSGMRPDATGEYAGWFPDDRAVRFIPQALFGPTGTMHTINNETNGPGAGTVAKTRKVRFVDVYANNEKVEDRMVGRYAYLVIDCSGMIDANGNHELDPDLGKTIARTLGTNVCEMAFTNRLTPELRAGREYNLHNGRVGIGGDRHQRFGRVESLEDLRSVAYGGYGNPPTDPKQLNSPLRAFSDPSPNSSNNFNYPRYFTTYTKYPDGYPAGFGGVPELQSTNLAADAQQVETFASNIADRLSSAMLHPVPAEINTLCTNIIDYMDTDYVPGGIFSGGNPFFQGPNADSFCTEPVPMLSRFDIMSNYTTPSNLVVTLYAETFFPFLWTAAAASNPPPQLQLNVKYRLNGGTFLPSSVDIASNISAGAFAWIQRTPALAPSSLQFSVPLGKGATNEHRSTAAFPVAPNGITITELSITIRGQNTVVDRVRPPVADLTASAGLAPYVSPFNQNHVIKWHAADPRINWDFQKTNQWGRTDRAPGVTGNRQFESTRFAREKNEWFAYVSNANKLFALGELGYLLHRSDRPWRTLCFFIDTDDDAQDYINPWAQFRLVYPTRYGLINPSTRITNVLATAFNKCPFQLAPADDRGEVLTAAGRQYLSPEGALAIASEIISRRWGQGYTNLSCLAGLSTLTTVSPAAPLIGNTSHMGREGILRCTEGLLGTRNNSFIVLVLGQGSTKLDDPESSTPLVRRTAGQRAIAMVWRDPFAPANAPKHFVRWMRWQDDWVGDISDQY